jgi:hypothetical protein
MWRSVAAVLAGFVLIFCLSMGGDYALRSLMPNAFGPNGQALGVPVLLITLAYVTLFATFGCWLTAALAPNRPMRHALILGGLGLLFSIVGTAMAWDRTPAWYNLLALALVMPTAWLGGRIRQLQLAARVGTGRPGAAPA